MDRHKLKTYCDKVQNRPETLSEIRWTYNVSRQWKIGDYLDLECPDGSVKSFQVTGSVQHDKRPTSEVIADGGGSFSKRQQQQVPLRYYATVDYKSNQETLVNKFW
jgi:hypothetical protein